MSEESKFKTQFVSKLKKLGHYGRRIEDKFGVGFPDMVLIVKGYPVFMCEAKLIKNNGFGPTERQWVELDRMSITSHCVPCIMGFDWAEIYLHPYARHVKISDCVVKRHDETEADFLRRFYHERIENEQQ